jgi:hypothetical protein
MLSKSLSASVFYLLEEVGERGMMRENQNVRGLTSNTATTEVGRDDQIGELLGSDLALTDSAFKARLRVFEDVEGGVEIVIAVIAVIKDGGKRSGYEEKRY